MPRRVSLPGAAELFRPTRDEDEAADRAVGTEPAQTGRIPTGPEPTEPAVVPAAPRRGGSGRVRHEEKITVYVSAEELLTLEQARLRLRAEHRVAVDRGRIVRAALALALDDLDRHGDDSALLHRLADRPAQSA